MTRIFTLFQRAKAYMLSHKKQTSFAVVVLVLGVYALTFLVPRPAAYSYGGDTCAKRLTFLPSIHKAEAGAAYDITYQGGLSLAGAHLAATEACFTPREAPQEGTAIVAVAPWGGLVARSHFSLHVPEAPVANVTALTQPIPATKPVELALSHPDETFDYILEVDGQPTVCDPAGTTLACDITELELDQGTTYESTLLREFNGGDSSELHAGTLETLSPVKITKTSIKHKQTVYTKPKSITIETDKPIEVAELTLTRQSGKKDAGAQEIALKLVVDENKVTATVEDDLPRRSEYKLQAAELTARDGSTLLEPRDIVFRTSGGPQLEHVSVGSTGAPVSGSITLHFDQKISQEQNVAKLVSVSGVKAEVIKGESSLTVQYSGADRCSKIGITVKKGLLSRHDVAQDKPITFSTRTQCYTTETIGYSHEGRPITAYFFGGGGKTVLFTGAIHGSEKSSYSTMMSWVNELEARAQDIPKGTQVVVAPMLNPDGYYVYGRDNARKVNLNRNFPTANWEKDITVTGGSVDKGGGGKSAGSERETQVLMALTNRLNPQVTLTYHSQGAFINSNAVAPAASLGARYAGLAGYGFVPDEATASTFGFAMTGTYEDWMTQTGRAAFLIELPSHYGDYLGQNQAALWAMVKG